MRLRIGFLTLTLAALGGLVPHTAAAQTLTGTWTGTSEGPRGSQTLTLELTQDGDALTGTVTFSGGGRRGGGRGGPGALVIHDGTVDGATFSFTVTLSFNGNEFTQSYSGSFEGDAMEGTIEGGRGGGRPFRAGRGG